MTFCPQNIKLSNVIMLLIEKTNIPCNDFQSAGYYVRFTLILSGLLEISRKIVLFNFSNPGYLLLTQRISSNRVDWKYWGFEKLEILGKYHLSEYFQ